MQTCNVIRDGMTRKGFIAAVEGQYGDLAVEYRPMLPEEVEETESAVASLQASKEPKKAVHAVAAVVASKIVNWSEVSGVDEKQPLTPSFENVRRLPYPMLNRLYRIIAGLSPSDANPDWIRKDQATWVDNLIAAASGKPNSDQEQRGN